MYKLAALYLFSLSSMLPLATPAGAISLGQIDDFEDGTTLGWGGDMPSISNIATNGPAGPDDSYLQISANGMNGPGSRLITYNTDQWKGDYVANQVTSISMDARNLGANPIHLRIALGDGGGIPSWYVSTTPVLLPPGSSWEHIVFSLDSMTRTLGDSPLASALADVRAFRILSSVDLPPTGGGGSRGDAIEAALGIDNITAVQVPEPTDLLLGCMFVTFAARGRRHSSC